MLIYNAPLVLYVPFAGRRLWHTLEGRVLVVWILMIMALSMIHLVAGLQQVPVASLLSFTLYSMAAWVPPAVHDPWLGCHSLARRT